MNLTVFTDALVFVISFSLAFGRGGQRESIETLISNANTQPMPNTQQEGRRQAVLTFYSIPYNLRKSYGALLKHMIRRTRSKQGDEGPMSFCDSCVELPRPTRPRNLPCCCRCCCCYNCSCCCCCAAAAAAKKGRAGPFCLLFSMQVEV